MSEDEVKPQSEEPTPEAIKKDEEIKETKTEVAEENDKVEENEEEEEEENDEKEKEKEESKEEEKKDEEKKDKEEEKEDGEKEDEGKLRLEDDDVKPEEKEVKKAKPVKRPLSEEPKTPAKNVVPLYDQPLEMSGKRDRKKVERFIQEEKKEELVFEGKGTTLADIPYINFMIQKTQHDDLRTLHRVAFNRPGKGIEIKKNLRQFNGFSYDKDDKKYESKTSTVDKLYMAELKKILSILGLEKQGNKGELVERVMEFMAKPHDSGRKAPTPKGKGKSKGRGRGRTKSGQKKAKNASSAEAPEDDSDEVSSSSGSENEVDDEDDDNENDNDSDEPPAKKAKKTPGRKTPAKTPTTKKTPAKKAAVKRPASSKKPKVSKTVSSDSESDDEPLAKKVKQPPTDVEIKGMVKKILDGANLEEVTMKSVCRQVYDAYPDFDLTHKKDFIKETVKSIIS